jgi:hypothetical protein
LFLGLLCTVVKAADTDTHIPDFYNEPGISAKRNYTGSDTEIIDPLSGSLQLVYGDLDISGNGDAGATVIRTYSPQKAIKGYGSGLVIYKQRSREGYRQWEQKNLNPLKKSLLS